MMLAVTNCKKGSSSNRDIPTMMKRSEKELSSRAVRKVPRKTEKTLVRFASRRTATAMAETVMTAAAATAGS